MTHKPRIFIGSSSESAKVADALVTNIESYAEHVHWKYSFTPGKNFIDDLITMSKDVDFSVFVFDGDDSAVSRGEEHIIVRDNVLFELGLFIGAIGKDRCIVLYPEKINVKIPTDISGITFISYNSERTDGRLDQALISAGSKIKSIVTAKGSLKATEKLAAEVLVSKEYELDNNEFLILSKIVENETYYPDGLSVGYIIDSTSASKHIIAYSLRYLESINFIYKETYKDHDSISTHVFYSTQYGVDFVIKNKNKFIQLLTPPPSPPAFDSSSFGSDDDLPF